MPDIVTMGKPVGNGYPLGVVVTTPEILAEFGAATELFSTFGGNPVACAAGLAVLEVIEHEELMENARITGERLRSGIRELWRPARAGSATCAAMASSPAWSWCATVRPWSPHRRRRNACWI